MITNLNYIISNGESFKHYYNDSNVCELFKYEYADYIAWQNTFLDSYYKQIATLNSDSKNVYYINLENVDTVSLSTIYITITFANSDTLAVSFINTDQAGDNYSYINNLITNYNIADYILTKTKINVTSIANFQTGIDSYSSGKIVYVQAGTYNLTSVLNINSSVEIYFEDNVTMNIIGFANIFNHESTTANHTIKIFGNAILNGGISVNNQATASFSQGLDFFAHCYSIAGTIYKGGSGRTQVKGYTKLYNIGNSLDTDALEDVFDIDFVYIIQPSSYLFHPLSATLSRVYFRNCNMSGNMYIDTGYYKLNFINVKYKNSVIPFTASRDSTLIFWNSYFKTNQDNLFTSQDAGELFLFLYGKNYSNKAITDYTTVKGIGTLTIDSSFLLT